MGIRGVAVAVAVVVVLGCALAVVAPAAADEAPNPAFAGRIVLSDRALPVKGRNLAAYNAAVKKQDTTTFVQGEQWRIHYAAFLRAPLADPRYVVKLYVVTDGRRRMLFAIRKTSPRGLTTLSSELAMQGAPLGTNRALLMTVESKGDLLAEAWFEVVAPAPAAE